MDIQQRLQQYETEVKNIYESYYAKFKGSSESVLADGLRILHEDIQDQTLDDLDLGQDTFMIRARQIGLALLKNGFYSTAEQFFRQLAKETEDYCQAQNKHLHVGAIYANIAAACFAQGNIDHGIVELLKAAQDDMATYEIGDKQDSYALTVLLPHFSAKVVKNKSLAFAKRVNSDLSLTDVEDLYKLLNTQRSYRDYALLAYVHIAALHEEVNQYSPNEFSQLQLFSALRSLSSLLEVELKFIANKPEDELWDILQELYGRKGKQKSWWKKFIKEADRIRRSNGTADGKIEGALGISLTDDDSRYWKSLLVSYFTRNYTIHQLETQCALVQIHSEEVLGHILHVMIAAPKYV